MTTKSASRALGKGKRDNLLLLPEGRARFRRKVLARNLWRDPAVPEYFPNWLVSFSVAGRSWAEMVKGFPVAQGMGPVRAWAKEMILTEAHKLQQGQIAELRSVRAKVRTVFLDELRPVYLSQVPPNKLNYARSLAKLERIGLEMTGLPLSKIALTDEVWSRENLTGWVRMRQEYFRRGWSADGGRVCDEVERDRRWEILRGELRAGKLPGVDKGTVMAGNTTILTYLRCAKSVFANKREYLLGLQLPGLKGLLEFNVDLAAPVGHKDIPAEVEARIFAGLGELRERDVKAWAFLMLVQETAARPVSIHRATLFDLRVVEGLEAEALRASCALKWGLPLERCAPIGGVLHLKGTKAGNAVHAALSEDLVSVLREIGTETSIYGAETVGGGVKIHGRVNAWLRGLGLEGTQGLYQLRHAGLQEALEEGGRELAMVRGGHTTPKMLGRYTEERRVVPLVRRSEG